MMIAIGNQYIDLAQILLSVHDPTLPTVGPLRRGLIQEADVSVPVTRGPSNLLSILKRRLTGGSGSYP